MLRYVKLHQLTLHCKTTQHNTLQSITLLCITLHGIAFVHCVALHYIAWHCSVYCIEGRCLTPVRFCLLLHKLQVGPAPRCRRGRPNLRLTDEPGWLLKYLALFISLQGDDPDDIQVGQRRLLLGGECPCFGMPPASCDSLERAQVRQSEAQGPRMRSVELRGVA